MSTEPQAASLDELLAGKEADKPIICAKCRVPVNTMITTADGEITFVHGQSYRHHDHDPIPIVAERNAEYASDCDFCGVRARMYWVFMTGQIQIATHDFGKNWSACRDCGPLFQRSDFAAIQQRVLAHAPRIRKMDPTNRSRVLEEFITIWQTLRSTQASESYIGPEITPIRLTARLMPKIQEGLTRLWDSSEWADALSTAAGREHPFAIPGVHAGDEDKFQQLYPPSTPIPLPVWTNHAQHLRAGIGTSTLYWISADFTQVANMAGRELEKMEITREELPSPFGIMVFEEPIGVMKRGDADVHVVAVSWSLVPQGVWLNLYIQPEEGLPEDYDVLHLRNQIGYLLCPNPGGGFQFGKTYDPPAENEPDFGLTVLAAWFLINQPGVAEVNLAPVDKKLARSAARAGRTLPPVQLVDLRKRTRRSSAEVEHVRGPLSVRVYRRGHWKRQAYGPQRGQRKLIYISPYIAGPEGAPLKERPVRVQVLR